MSEHAVREPVSGKPIRVAVVGAGDFGRNHVRVYRELVGARLIGLVDLNPARARQVAEEFSTDVLPGLEALPGRVDAVSLAVPTADHARIGRHILEQGMDLLVEKPIAASLPEADDLISTAKKHGRVLQVGHLERFNPAIVAVEKVVLRPLFFEVHRLGIFSPRSLDVDVVYDVMIHDLEILLALAPGPVVDIRAVGIPVLSDKVDIAHARIEFESGAVANVTASRVSTERVRKLRFFQLREYISVDYARQEALRVRVSRPGPQPQFDFEKLATQPEEPLRAELRGFLEAVRTRSTPRVDGPTGRRALELADRVMGDILEHGRRVQLGAFATRQIV